MDPTHRILVEHSCYAMSAAQERLGGAGSDHGGGDHAAAQSMKTLRGATSVYVGCMWSEYDQFLASNLGVNLGPSVSTGTGISFMAGRVSYTLDLKVGGRGLTHTQSSSVSLYSISALNNF